MAGVLGLVWECHTYERWAFKRRQIFLSRELAFGVGKIGSWRICVDISELRVSYRALKETLWENVTIQRALISKLLTARPVFNESDMPRLCSLYDFTEVQNVPGLSSGTKLLRSCHANTFRKDSRCHPIDDYTRKKVPGVDIRRHVGGTPSGSGTERGPIV